MLFRSKMSAEDSLKPEIYTAPGNAERRPGISVPPMKRYVEKPESNDETPEVLSREQRIAKGLTAAVISVKKIWLDITQP